MNGNTYNAEGYTIIDRDDVDSILSNIRTLATEKMAYPDGTDGAQTATAVFAMIRNAVDDYAMPYMK